MGIATENGIVSRFCRTYRRPRPTRRRRAIPALVLVVAAGLASGCGDDGPGNYVVELDYNADAIESGQRRRIDLLRGGVRGAVHEVWRNAVGLTFVARRPAGAEPGIKGLRARRHGLPARVEPQGIRRNRFGRLVVEPGYQIVDIYSSRDTYLNSALTDTAMSGRRILNHLGMARRLSARVDRLYMGADEQLYWRQLLPVVLANDGYGWIYLPEARDPTEGEGDEETGKAMGRRYDVQEAAGVFLLVGEQRGEQSYWHVFTAGQDYITTALKYGPARLEREEALLLLGFVDQVDG